MQYALICHMGQIWFIKRQCLLRKVRVYLMFADSERDVKSLNWMEIEPSKKHRYLKTPQYVQYCAVLNSPDFIKTLAMELKFICLASLSSELPAFRVKTAKAQECVAWGDFWWRSGHSMTNVTMLASGSCKCQSKLQITWWLGQLALTLGKAQWRMCPCPEAARGDDASTTTLRDG